MSELSVLIKLEERVNCDRELLDFPDVLSQEEERVAVPAWPGSSMGSLFTIYWLGRVIWVYHLNSFFSKLVVKSLPLSIAISSRDSLKIVFHIKAKMSFFTLICESVLHLGVMCHSSPTFCSGMLSHSTHD